MYIISRDIYYPATAHLSDTPAGFAVSNETFGVLESH